MKNVNVVLENYCMNICMIAGPSAQGKSYLESELTKNGGKFDIYLKKVDENDKKKNLTHINFRKIVQCTTRRKRPNESYNPYQFYYFINKDKYNEMNSNNLLFGRTSIDYKAKNNKVYTNYYGSIIPVEDIFRAYYKEKFYGEKTIFTVILNAKGIEDLLNFLDQDSVSLSKNGIQINNLTFNLFGIKVDGNNSELRKGRDASYVENERQELERYNNYFTYSYFNDFKNNKTLTEDDIIDLTYDFYNILKDLDEEN